MKQDISFDSVEGITIAIVPDEEAAPGPDGSEGYGTQPTGEAVRTTTLRYHLPVVGPHSATPVELIDPAVFHLTNQYWVSYYRDSKIFDKKFVFVPDSIVAANLNRLDLLAGRVGVLHG